MAKKIYSGEELRIQASRIIAQKLGSFVLMQDYYFTAFMQDNAACLQVMLRAFTGYEDIEVTKVTVQHVIKNGSEGRGVRYDCRVETKRHGIYNMEVENNPDGSLELRLRYYAAMLDKENLKKHEDYSLLPEVTTIIITPKDMTGEGKPLSYVRRVYVKSPTESGDNPKIFDDKMMFIFVNAKYKGTDTLVGKVIHDLTSPSESEKLVEEFAEAMDIYVRTEEGRVSMSNKITEYSIEADDLEHLLSETERLEAMGQGRAEGHAEGRAEGKAEGRLEGLGEGIFASLRNLIKNAKFSIEQAMDTLEIPAAERDKYAAMLRQA